ncbi:hypothetical protein [Actinomadura rifamycini]|uniref:hypothetical protein n=1 Tax=Actinomadura rifamycini TaxID=31962 RepID=UPI0003FDA5D8|nr:hypothetical protein [Actinomadura rifamycini]
MNTTLIGLDIPNFGDERRTRDVQQFLRGSMYDVVADSLAITGLHWHECHHEDRGDGALIIAPPTAHAFHVLDPLAHHLTARLRRANRITNDVARLRLRVAVHSGDVHFDTHGVLGHAVTRLFRLLDAPAFKQAISAAPDSDVGMLVSDDLYRAAVADDAVDRDAYRPLYVTCKETRNVRAHLWMPPRHAR